MAGKPSSECKNGRTGRPRVEGPGLAEMRASTPEGQCPFCLDSIPPAPKKKFRFCGDPVCLTAYHRTRARDVRRGVVA